MKSIHGSYHCRFLLLLISSTSSSTPLPFEVSITNKLDRGLPTYPQTVHRKTNPYLHVRFCPLTVSLPFTDPTVAEFPYLPYTSRPTPSDVMISFYERRGGVTVVRASIFNESHIRNSRYEKRQTVIVITKSFSHEVIGSRNSFLVHTFSLCVG